MKTISLAIIAASIVGGIIEVHGNYTGTEVDVTIFFGILLGCGIRLYRMSRQEK